MIRIPFLNRVLFTSAVVATLAFGTSQAIASPNPQHAKAAVCFEDLCSQWCGGPGYCEKGSDACICI